jgi:aspartyl-tRNA(Asn)/glutamyl-tRNA(Gln) amidotransferase subunit B
VRDGRVGAAGQIVGGVMKASGGKANAAAVRELVLARLGS